MNDMARKDRIMYDDILTREILIKEYNELGSISAMAEKFGVSTYPVISRMKIYDIPYKKKIRYTCDENFFGRDNEESFYWAGFMAADGNITKNSSNVNIYLGEKDAPHLEKFRLSIKSNTPVKIYQRAGEINTIIKPNGKIQTMISGNRAVIRIGCWQMVKDLARFNVVPAKTKIYTIPDWLKEHFLFHHFIRGYFDGDGWFSFSENGKYKKMSCGICGNLQVLETFREFFIKQCNLSSNGYLGAEYISDNNSLYRISFQKFHDMRKIVDCLYADANIFLERKKVESDKVKQIDDGCFILNLDKNDLLASYERLGNYDLVAEEFGCSRTSIYEYMKKFNILPLIKKSPPFGENHKMSKLTEEQVLEIINKYVPRKYSQKKLADEYNVSQGTIGKIINKKRWKHINNNKSDKE
jgi:predicted DNA-binding protein YlxM (UPF0122 family)